MMEEECKRRYDTPDQIDFDFAKTEAEFCARCRFQECVNCLNRGLEYAERVQNGRKSKKHLTIGEKVRNRPQVLLPHESDKPLTAAIRQALRTETDVTRIAEIVGTSVPNAYRIIGTKILQENEE